MSLPRLSLAMFERMRSLDADRAASRIERRRQDLGRFLTANSGPQLLQPHDNILQLVG